MTAKWVLGDIAVLVKGLLVYDTVKRNSKGATVIRADANCIIVQVGLRDGVNINLVELVVPGRGVRGFIEEACLKRLD